MQIPDVQLLGLGLNGIIPAIMVLVNVSSGLPDSTACLKATSKSAHISAIAQILYESRCSKQAHRTFCPNASWLC